LSEKRKIEKNGRANFEEIQTIPKFRKRLEDVGSFKRSDFIKRLCEQSKICF
jgi:hypothetical protein